MLTGLSAIALATGIVDMSIEVLLIIVVLDIILYGVGFFAGYLSTKGDNR